METQTTRPFEAEVNSVDDRLREGLLDLWYLIARSQDVTFQPLGITRLGQPLVLWRDEKGTVRAVEDYCPHRGAPLSLGTVCDGFVTCPYHGLQLDGDGIIKSTPPTPDSPFVGDKAIRAYPTREIGGAVWAYFASTPGKEPPEPVFPEEITSPDWSSFLFATEWNCNWQIALDNRLDPVHGSYLHSGTFTLSYGRKDAELKIEKTEHGFETFRLNQRGVNLDWHEVIFHPENVCWIRTEVPYPIKVGGGSFRINGYPTPIDANRTYVWFYRSCKVSDWERDLWRFLYKNRLENRNLEVVEQDRAVLEAIPVAARNREMLLQTDIAVARMRRMLREEATRQFEHSTTSAEAAAE